MKAVKILKWFFLALWLICIVLFLAGQKMAPSNYSTMSGNPWGALFGVSLNEIELCRDYRQLEC